MAVWKVRYRAAVPDGGPATAKFKKWLDDLAERKIPPGTKPPEYEPAWRDVCGGEPREHDAYYEAATAEEAKGMLEEDFRMCRTEVLGAEKAPGMEEDAP